MLEIKKHTENEYLTLEIQGDIDASSSIHLDAAMEEALGQNPGAILIDASHLEYISSAGLGVFMSYIQELENKNISLVFYGMSEKVKNVFQILGLDQLLTITETAEDAKRIANEL
ncbi:STAS domain-containing protein [Cytophagales bacterium LB-30]|uniref:Anti-sigma factor antagonist n=1 Tax=Shiella aurantiaca TaxID=3058365 RepID=A0ABT8F2K9_9BACT|nr:STAS domain-containing protein [Shiella aurantiaca]MDN4164645.1 STAS domain-containing protein [Shiella aurantiaca]